MTNYLLKEKEKDIWEIFLKYIDLLFSHSRSNKLKNHAYQMDAFELITPQKHVTMLGSIKQFILIRHILPIIIVGTIMF